MKVYDTARIRNVAVVGHGGSGKTQLISGLLHAAGAVPRMGLVQDGTAVTDFDEESIARRHTLAATLAHAEWRDAKLNLVDTPGVGAFLTEARAALRVVEAALLAVDGVAGVEVQTEKLWQDATALGLPRIAVLTRMDRDRASLPRALEDLHAHIDRAVIPVQLPIGEGRDLSGVVDLVGLQAWTGGEAGPIPEALSAEVSAARGRLIEAVAEADESLMERFFAEGTLTQDELTAGLRRGVAAGSLVPLACCATLSGIGLQPLLDLLLTLVPSPAERPLPAQTTGGEATTVEARAEGPYAAFAWKTIADAFAGHITLLRVGCGTLASDSTVHNATRNSSERLGHLLVVQGKTQTHVPVLPAGDLGAVAKLKDTRTNDTLAEAATPIRFAPIPFPEPVLAYAIEPRTRGDEDKISTAMHRLEEEDPTIAYTRDPQTHELLLAGQGQLHIEVTVARLRRRFGVEVVLKPPRIPYRETITAATEAHGRHKKQTGGHGQFGDCKVRVEPLPRGSDFEFIDEIFGGAIPRQFVPAIEKGIQEARTRGFLAGYPMVDFRVTVVDGSYHDVDSNELSFKMAGALALKDAMTRARPTLLEPVMLVEVHAPSDFAGDLMGDLNGRRGHVDGMDTRGGGVVIRAKVPMAEMLTYEQHLTSATGGRGSYHMEYSHYAEVPHAIQAKVIAHAKAERGHGAHEEA